MTESKKYISIDDVDSTGGRGVVSQQMMQILINACNGVDVTKPGYEKEISFYIGLNSIILDWYSVCMFADDNEARFELFIERVQSIHEDYKERKENDNE